MAASGTNSSGVEPHGSTVNLSTAALAPVLENPYKYGIKPVAPGGSTMKDIIKRLGRAELQPMEASNFVKPLSVFYELDGKRRRWDMIQSHGSVGIIIYHTEQQAFLMVRQFRPAVYGTQLLALSRSEGPPPPLEVGFTHELCAGIIDKDKPLEEIAAEEVLEECGFKVDPSNVKPATTYVSAVGVGGARHLMYYVEVTEGMRQGPGGGIEGEAIEVLALPMAGAEAFMNDAAFQKSAGLLFGLMWLREHLRSR